MKTIFIFLLLFVLASTSFLQANNILYPIKEGKLWGYIDRTGKVVIKPQYLSAGRFSEGLAPVRLNGTYGYINSSGRFVIAPKYDVASLFQGGIAKVFIDGKPFFINKEGEIIFQHNFKSITLFNSNTFTIAVTSTDKYCLINKAGRLLTDTVFKSIEPFVDGLAVVQGLRHAPYPEDSTQAPMFEVGVIDTTGAFIIPYGRYKNISNFSSGFACAERYNQSSEQRKRTREVAVIDKYGNLKFLVPLGKYSLSFDNTDFYHGLAIVRIYPEPSSTTTSWSSDNSYRGVIDTNGRILFSDTTWKEITPFTLNRAFVQYKNNTWKLIDKNGHQVSDVSFDDILYESYRDTPDKLFTNGRAYAKRSKEWVAIDTSGKIFPLPTAISKTDIRNLYRLGDVLFFYQEARPENSHYPFLYGFWNSTNNVMVKPTYNDIDMNGFTEDVITAISDGRLCYVTTTGEVLWKEEEVPEIENALLNIDCMNRGYYYASSLYNKELVNTGGWWRSENKAKTLSDAGQYSQQLQLIVDTSRKTTWEGYKAVKLFVVNASADTLYFDAQDSRLQLTIQAQDKKGEWKDIEYLPRSWCGNSYHTLFLAPNQLWEFATPIYHGEYKTKLRAQLLYKKSKKQKEKDVLYSNEYEGYVNPGQFWNKRSYSPSGLMDPYND